MKFSKTALALLLIQPYSALGACPFAHLFGNTADEIENPHEVDRANDKIDINKKREEVINEARKLQVNCNGEFLFTQGVYDQIMDDVREIASTYNLGNGERGRFYGGMLRLAAHDFMDFDRNAQPEFMGGSDGCLNFEEEDNIGLEATWVPEGAPLEKPPLQLLYEDTYEVLGMSRADFWVAAANAVIKDASPNRALDLPFRWGRESVDDCNFSLGRQPKAKGCDDVEEGELQYTILDFLQYCC